MAYSELPKLKKNSVSTTIASPGINDTDTTIPVTELSVFYDADSNLITQGIVIGYDNSNETYAEEITITGASGTSGAGNLTGATRGVNADGTTGAAKAHVTTTNIAVMFSTGIYEQIRANDQVFATIPNKNKIINGNFAVNQEVVSGTVTLSAGEYGHDMWCGGSQGCTYTFASSGGVTTLTISAGSLIQVIEGINLISDTYCLSWTGTAQGKIGAGSFSSSGVTGSVTGGANLNIEFGTGTLSKVQLEQGSYPTAFEHRLYGAELALCQRYWWMPHISVPVNQDFGTSVDAGKYNTLIGNGCNYIYNATVHTSGGGGQTPPIFFPVEMRVAPTVTFYGNNNALYSHPAWYQDKNGTAIWYEATILTSTSKSITINGVPLTYGDVAYRAGGFTCDARLSP